ncbi:NUDIX hydrolase [Rhizohabitans arisaemae]|uniref:NUDIX hydrolase n=1 Tax=Rhizohabitans arisaemae TaxID=2720610 RepID=UPI0024B18125|nr:NUDIX hydrolase [Rhizohabitans arisaemae]
MKWTVHGRRSIYASDWVSLDFVDVELPDGQRFEQHVVRMARPVAGTAVLDEADRVLLMWRHRHVTDTWGWEIPMGRVEEGEDPAQAAAREVEEETGWRPGPLRPLVVSQPSNGSIKSVHHLFLAEHAEHIGPPVDVTEAERIEWIPLSAVFGLISAGEIVSGPTLIALLYLLARPVHGTR